MLEGFKEVIEIEISPYLKFSMYPVGREYVLLVPASVFSPPGSELESSSRPAEEFKIWIEYMVEEIFPASDVVGFGKI
jgi:hypothetical protein